MRPALSLLALLAPILLIACSPAEQCRIEAMRELRILDRQIDEAEGNVARGYRKVPVRNPYRIGLSLCVADERVCAAADNRPDFTLERINVEAEQAKLASLRQQRNRLLPQVQRALAACPAE